jgi:hypothetical protein
MQALEKKKRPFFTSETGTGNGNKLLVLALFSFVDVGSFNKH